MYTSSSWVIAICMYSPKVVILLPFHDKVQTCSSKVRECMHIDCVYACVCVCVGGRVPGVR